MRVEGLVSLSVRLKDLLGTVTRVKKKKKVEVEAGRGGGGLVHVAEPKVDIETQKVDMVHTRLEQMEVGGGTRLRRN